MANYILDVDLCAYFNGKDGKVKKETIVHFFSEKYGKNIVNSITDWLSEKKKKGQLKSLGSGYYIKSVKIIPCKLREYQKNIGMI